MNSIKVLDAANKIYSAEVTILKVKTSRNASESHGSYDEFHILALVNPVAEQPYQLLSFTASLYRNERLTDIPLLFPGVEAEVIYQEKNHSLVPPGNAMTLNVKPTLELLHLDVDWNSTTGTNSLVASIQTSNKKLNERLFKKRESN